MKTASQIFEAIIGKAVPLISTDPNEIGSTIYKTTRDMLATGPITAAWLVDLVANDPDVLRSETDNGSVQERLADLMEDILMAKASIYVEKIMEDRIRTGHTPEPAILAPDEPEKLKTVAEMTQAVLDTWEHGDMLDDDMHPGSGKDEAHQQVIDVLRTEVSKGISVEWLEQTLRTNPDIVDSGLDDRTAQEHLQNMVYDYVVDRALARKEAIENALENEENAVNAELAGYGLPPRLV